MALATGGCGNGEGKSRTATDNPTRSQSTLDELNRQGGVPHEGRSYRYAMQIPCKLEITTQLGDSRAGVITIDLAADQLERFDFALGLGYAVRSAANIAHPNVFTSVSGEKADQVRILLNSLRKECAGHAVHT